MILHDKLPLTSWMEDRTRRLPGLSPVALADWLMVDEVFAEQMALRDLLIREQRSDVFQEKTKSHEVSQELLSCLKREIPGRNGYVADADNITRPDGVKVHLDIDQPLVTAGRLVQEDLLILEQVGNDTGYVLTAGLLCFPASWDLSQKIGRPLPAIHSPVASYNDDISNRVNRVFDGLRAGQPLMRANFLIYTDPSLHQPRREGEEKPIDSIAPRYVRVERQTLRRLPETRAVVFAIHTYIVTAKSLSPDEYDRLANIKPELTGGTV